MGAIRLTTGRPYVIVHLRLGETLAPPAGPLGLAPDASFLLAAPRRAAGSVALRVRDGRSCSWYARHRSMVTVQVQLPEEAFSALRRSPDEMAGDLRLAAAVHWYSRGLMSQERAAQVAGLDRTDFILALAREGVDAFAVDLTSLRRELAHG